MSAPLHLQLAAELESMARVAEAKGKPSAPLLQELAKSYRAHGSIETEAEQRTVFSYALELAEEVDRSGATIDRAREVVALVNRNVL